MMIVTIYDSNNKGTRDPGVDCFKQINTTKPINAMQHLSHHHATS